jgi:hypothetical protein
MKAMGGPRRLFWLGSWSNMSSLLGNQSIYAGLSQFGLGIHFLFDLASPGLIHCELRSNIHYILGIM